MASARRVESGVRTEAAMSEDPLSRTVSSTSIEEMPRDDLRVLMETVTILPF